jgi:predicted transcriptional regulator
MEDQSKTQDVLRGAIRLCSQNLRISQSELAKSAKVSQPVISRFVTGTTNLSEKSRKRVQRALLRAVETRIAAAHVVQNERACFLCPET